MPEAYYTKQKKNIRNMITKTQHEPFITSLTDCKKSPFWFRPELSKIIKVWQKKFSLQKINSTIKQNIFFLIFWKTEFWTFTEEMMVSSIKLQKFSVSRIIADMFNLWINILLCKCFLVDLRSDPEKYISILSKKVKYIIKLDSHYFKR